MTATSGLLLALLACRSGSTDSGAAETGDGGSMDDGGAAQDGGADGGAGDVTVTVSDEQNYSFVGVLDGPSFPLAELQDVSLSWAGLDKDLQCHDLDPVEDIDNVALMIFSYLTEEEVEQGLAEDSLEQVDLAAYLSYEPGTETSASLTDLTFFGTDADIETLFTEGSGTWMMVLTTGTKIGVGSRMIAFLEPTAGDGLPTTAEVTDGCSVLDWEADLSSLAPASVPMDGVVTIDWSAVSSTGYDTPFDTLAVSDLMVARYDESPAQLEEDFLDLELLATDTWTGPHASGTQADLSQLTHTVDGTPFSGFDDGGTWLFAIRCDTCPNPAPLFLTVLQPG